MAEFDMTATPGGRVPRSLTVRHFRCRAMLACAVVLVHLGALSAEPDAAQRRAQAIQLMMQGDNEGALKILERLGAAGDAESDIYRGALLSKLGRTSEAIQLLEPLALAGNVEAQWRLSVALAQASPPMLAEGQVWLRRAAQGGHATARNVLNQQKDLPPVVNGKVLVSDLSVMIGRVVSEKVKNYSDAVLACYRADRETFAANIVKDIPQCVQRLPDDMQVSVDQKTVDHFVRTVAQCVNAEAFKRAGKTPSEMAACLPPP